jgi:hypothetical protein
VSRRMSAFGWPSRAAVVAVASASLFLLMSVPSADAAAPLVAPFTNGCDPYTYGDPYIAYQYGTVGDGDWLENFTAGVFVLPQDQYARAASGQSSSNDIDPWIHFGPGTPTPTSCIVESHAVKVSLAFLFHQIVWTVQLQAICSGEGTATAAYSFNVTGDLYDYTTSTWVVSSITHASTTVATHTVSCSGSSGSIYNPGPQSLADALASTGARTYTLQPNQDYFYFADVMMIVSATAAGDAAATAQVSQVGLALQAASCVGC